MLIQLDQKQQQQQQVKYRAEWISFLIAAFNAWKSGGNDQISRRHSGIL